MSLKVNLNTLQTKAKERTVKTQSIEYDLETLVKKIKSGIIKLDPDYQRRHRWDKTTSSKLIESLILNIPIPIIYLSYDIDVDDEDDGARYSVIDGQQRLTSIVRFFDGKYQLQGLEILTDLDGCTYKDLPPFLLRRLEERTLKCLRIDSTIDPQVKYDIFERLNSGSVKLESHELRNATHRGPFNDLCKVLSKDANFRTLLQIKDGDIESNSKIRKMEDVELVLRFFALSDENYKNYKKTKGKQFKDFLSECLAKFNELPDIELHQKSELFKNTMEEILSVFGELAFAKYKYEGGRLEKQSNFNAAVYDALTIGLTSEIDVINYTIAEETVTQFISLFKDPIFYESVSGSILDSNKIVTRIEMAREIFR